MEQPINYTFYTDTSTYTIQIKNGKPRYYVTGYITTKDRDLINDVVTEEAMQNMLGQLVGKNLKLDVEHEAWTQENPSIIPLGRIIEANKDDKGIFIKAELNSHANRFKEVWNSIKEKFIDGFSIAYIPVKAVQKTIDGVSSRLLQEVKLLNVALTGNPMNPQARIHEVMMKSLDNMKTTEEQPMPENKVETKNEPVPAEPAKPALEAELKSLFEAQNKHITEMLEAKFSGYEAKLAELNVKLEKPMLKALAEKPMPKIEEKSIPMKKNPLDIL
jgi:HK97 family phage prohead protease